MARAGCVAPLWLLAALPSLILAQGAGPQTQTLPAFSTIQACVPFNVYITPSGGGGPDYGLQVDAEQEVAQAVQWNVDQGTGTLQLESGAFIASQPIKVAVYLPADQLKEVDHLGQLSTIYVGEGFTPDSFTLRQGAGGGGMYVFNMQANSLTISASGSIGDVVAMGSFGKADVTTQGIANIGISGVKESVSVQLGGITNLYLESASPDLQISGSADGISKILYTQGQCSVQSAFLLSSPCQQSSAVSVGASVPSPSWTQGFSSRGAFTCAAGMGLLAPQLQFPAVAFPPIVFPPMAPIAPIAPVPAPQPKAPAPKPKAPKPAPKPSGQAQASATATAGGSPAPQASPSPSPSPSPMFFAPAPSPEASPGPYAFTVPGPTGTQSQAGSVTPGGSQGQASSSGQKQASASVVAGPAGVQTGTVSDGQGYVAGTQG